jgi:hypothetical protein
MVKSDFLSFPSFYAHVLNGIFLLVAIILLFKNYTSIKKIDNYKIIIMILLFSIASGVHGISHLSLEKGYSYNPLEVVPEILSLSETLLL